MTRWLLALMFVAGCVGPGKGVGPRELPDDTPVVDPNCVPSDEVCDGEDNDCDGLIDERGAKGGATWFADLDGDGFGADPAVEACEQPGTAWVDADGDCDDGRPDVHPGAAEACDGVDSNCDGTGDVGQVWYVDGDGDGYGAPGTGTFLCSAGSGLVANDDDCDDASMDVNPAADETCNTRDDDCDGVVDNDPTDGLTWYLDLDGDSFGQATTAIACTQPPGHVPTTGDCNDGAGDAHPGGFEVCDGLDNDCDGLVDAAALDLVAWYIDNDGDGYGAGAVTTACEAPSPDHVANGEDCNDGIPGVNPSGQELCNGLDDDCSGTADDAPLNAGWWFDDVDGDGFGDPTTGVRQCTMPSGAVANDADCDDAEATALPGGTETCDGLDNDCDGLVDESVPGMPTWYLDSDEDGFGDVATAWSACTAPSGFVADGTDCDDLHASAYVGAVELCDGVDNDCNGSTDEGPPASAPDWYPDTDGDGAGDENASPQTGCAAPGSGFVTNADDCDDGDATVSGNAIELCGDSIDNDCSGTVDGPDAADARTWFADVDGDGWGDDAASVVACVAPSGHVSQGGDCDDGETTVAPDLQEVCSDGRDNDCSGDADGPDAIDANTWYVDRDGDGEGTTADIARACTRPNGYAAQLGDCDDADANVFSFAIEKCDGVDNNCDGLIDNSPNDQQTWYLDRDGDGVGGDLATAVGCEAPTADHVATGGDCNDFSQAFRPEAPGVCAQGVSCEDIRLFGLDAGDGLYTLDLDTTDGVSVPFDTLCHFGTDGSGWTLIARNGWDNTWNATNAVDASLFGVPGGAASHKNRAWNELLFNDLLFRSGSVYAMYENVGDGQAPYFDFQDAIPRRNDGSAYQWPLTEGNIDVLGSQICETNLYMHVCDRDGGTNGCVDNNESWGPAWNAVNNASTCYFDDPDYSSFRWQQQVGPFGRGSPLTLWVR